jgi:hypothetical protein
MSIYLSVTDVSPYEWCPTKRSYHYLQRFWKATNALNTKELYLAVEDYQKKMFLEINYLETATTQLVYAKKSLDP